MRKLFLSLCLLAAVVATAQEAETPASPWKFGGLVGLNASATGLVNWAAGGNNNLSGLAFGKLNLDYAEGDLAWNTTLDLEYGLTFVDQKFDKLQKSSDRINFATKFGWAFQPKWFLSVNAGFQSQFALGRNYPGDGTDADIISKFLAPSYTDISVGFDYKPVDFFSLYMSPIAGRITTAYVSDAVNNKYKDLYPILEDGTGGLRDMLREKNGTYYFDKDTNKKMYRNARAELGLNVKAALNYTYKDLKLITSLGLFSPYAWDKTKMYVAAEDGNTYTEAQMKFNEFVMNDENFLGYRDNNRRFGLFDVNWDMAISYQFLKCLNVTLSTSLKYIPGLKIADKDGLNPAERVQFQGILGLGIGYAF